MLESQSLVHDLSEKVQAEAVLDEFKRHEVANARNTRAEPQGHRHGRASRQRKMPGGDTSEDATIMSVRLALVHIGYDRSDLPGGADRRIVHSAKALGELQQAGNHGWDAGAR